jgi:uncharacterized protein YegP (UPF0339 family)
MGTSFDYQKKNEEFQFVLKAKQGNGQVILARYKHKLKGLLERIESVKKMHKQMLVFDRLESKTENLILI